MIILNKLKKLDLRYKEYIEGGATNSEAAKGSVQEVLESDPYIYKDDDGFSTHFFIDKYVYFFGGDIYKTI